MFLLSPYELQVYKSAFESPFSEKGKKARSAFMSWLPSGVSVPQMSFFTVRSKEPWVRVCTHTQKTYVTRKVFVHAWIHLTLQGMFQCSWEILPSVIFNSVYFLWFMKSVAWLKRLVTRVTLPHTSVTLYMLFFLLESTSLLVCLATSCSVFKTLSVCSHNNRNHMS